MELGVHLNSFIESATPDEIAAVAHVTESAGYGSLWIGDHIAMPTHFRSRYPFTNDGVPSFALDAPWLEALSTLAFLAGVTDRIRLGTSVIPIITRDPLTLAKQAATVDTLSRGRLELGLGAGWLLEEATALSRPADRKWQRLLETAEILRLAWGNGTLRYSGQCYEIPEVILSPQPPQGAQIPLWIGGHSPRAIQIARRLRVGLLTWQPTPDDLQRLSDALAKPTGDHDEVTPLGVMMLLPGTAPELQAELARARRARVALVVLVAQEPGPNALSALLSFVREEALLA